MTKQMWPAIWAVGVVVAVGLATMARAAQNRVAIPAPRLGVLNLIGNDAIRLIAEDLAAFGSLFGKPVQSTGAAPPCDVLLVYAKLRDSGLVEGSKLGLREIIRDSGAKVVLVASENSGAAYTAGTPKKPYGRANLVMTLERRGDRFPTFFSRLFKMMFDGDTMPVAWVKLAPQAPNAPHPEAPETIFAAEAGQVTLK